MRRIVLAATLVLMAATLHATPARAMAWGAELFGGWNTFAMEAFNDSLAEANQALGTNFEPIENGGSFGLALRLWPTDQLLLRVELEGMLASTEDSGVTFDIGPGIWAVSGTWFFQTGPGPRFGVGGGVGGYSISGELKGPGGTFDTAGSGFGIHGKAEFLVPLAKGLSLSGILGYRHAVVDNLEVDNQATDTEADFSGLMVRAGVAFDVP